MQPSKLDTSIIVPEETPEELALVISPEPKPKSSTRQPVALEPNVTSGGEDSYFSCPSLGPEYRDNITLLSIGDSGSNSQVASVEDGAEVNSTQIVIK